MECHLCASLPTCKKNQYGVFYFPIVFPQEIRFHVQKREFKRSLHTVKKSTLSVSQGSLDQIFNLIRHKRMDWIATKKLLDRVAADILAGYKDYLFVHGLYPDVVDRHPLKNAEEDVQYFLEMKNFPQEHFEEEGTLQKMEERYGEDAEIIQHFFGAEDMVVNYPQFHRQLDATLTKLVR